jgi:hypothetical protein
METFALLSTSSNVAYVVRDIQHHSKHVANRICNYQKGEKEMNKLTALSKLSGAYNDQHAQFKLLDQPTNKAALDVIRTKREILGVLAHSFYTIAATLTLADLAPTAKQDSEGLNPPGPKYF